MNGGLISCACEQQQYVETVNETVLCIKCEKQHQVYPIPEVEDSPEVGDQNGTNI